MSDQGYGIASRPDSARIVARPRRRLANKSRSSVGMRDRFAYRPGNGLGTLDRLEERLMLDGSNDLTSTISGLLNGGAVSGQYSFTNQKIGNFLTVPSIAIGLSNVSHTDASHWTGTVSIDASSASLAIGSFTGSIAGAQGIDGLLGSYTLSGQALDHGAYSLAGKAVALSVPNAFDATASDVHLDYNPAAATGQTLATIGSATATIKPLNNATVAISNLVVRDDGFSLANATVSAGAFGLGGIISATAPTFGFSGVSYTTGSPLLGTITATAASAALFPGNASLTASVANFRGTYDLGTTALALSADSGELAVGRIFDAKATGIGLTWDGSTATVDLKNADLTSPLLPGADASLADFHGDNAGFTLGQADLTVVDATLGGLLEVKGLDLGVSNLSYSTATGKVGGSFSIATGVGLPAGSPSVLLLPKATALSSTISGFAASYSLDTNTLTASVTGATIKAGSSLEIDTGKVGFSFTAASGNTPYQVSASVASATASLPQVGVSGTIANLQVTNDGFHLDSASLAGPASVSAFGGKFTIANPSATLTNFGYSTAGGASFNSDVVVSATEIDARPGASASFQATGVTAKVAFTSSSVGAFSFDATEVKGNLGSALAIDAKTVHFGYDPSAASGQTIASIGSATATLTPLAGANLSLSNLVVRDNGFSLGDATVTADAIKLGGVVSVTAPSINLHGIAYTTGSPLLGTITATAASAALFPGNASLTASVANFRGTYDLGTTALALSADSGELAVGRIFDAKATGIGLTWDGSTATVDLKTATLTSPLLPGVAASIADLHGDNTGFTLGHADLAVAEAKIGGVLDITNLHLTVDNLVYTASTHAIVGTFGVSTVSTSNGVTTTGKVSILPNAKALTSTVTGFAATYDLASDTLTTKADSAVVKAGSSLQIVATGLAFSLTPSSGGDDAVTVTVASATASLPQEGITGSITGLQITNDGFSLAGATLAKAGLVSAFDNKFSIKDPSATLTNFGYSAKANAFTNGAAGNAGTTVAFSASEVDFTATASATATATGLTATLDFSDPSNPGHFTFKAGDVTTSIKPFLSLDATNISFDSAPTAGANMAQFGSVTASLNVGALNVSGSGKNFAIDASGHFVALAGFGVSLSTSADSSKFQWPSWLPIQISKFDISWPNFAADPTNFVLDLSAAVDANVTSSSLHLYGSVTDAIIDTGLLKAGQFPIKSLGGATLGVSGSLFGSTITAAATFHILNVDASGNPIAAGSATPVANRYFYGGIDGAVSIAGEAGFHIRLGISSLGPLDALLEVDTQIILDPSSGLAINNFYAAVDFNTSLPAINTAQALATSPVLKSANSTDWSAWDQQLAAQAAAQAKNVASGLSALSGPIKISAGATVYDAYATENAFKLVGNIVFDTTGKFAVFGTLTIGNSVSILGAAYVDLSQAQQGIASLLLYAKAPADTPLATIYGSVLVQAATDLNLDGSSTYAAANNLAIGSGPFTVELSSKRLDSGKAEVAAGESGLTLGYNASNAFYVTYGSTTLTTPMAPTAPKADDGAWHRWAATFTGDKNTTGTLTLYRDGSQVASASGVSSTNLTDPNFTIGKSGSTFFHGYVDVVRVWSVAQPATTINSIYNTLSLTSTAGLIASWAFYAGSEIVATDLSGQGHPLLILGAAATLTGTQLATYWAAPADSPFKNNGFELTITGEVILALPGLPGGLDVKGSASFQVNIAALGFELMVNGSAYLAPLAPAPAPGSTSASPPLIALAGDVHFDNSGGSPKLYGALVVNSNLGQLPLFKAIGLDVSAVGYLQFNTTAVAQPVVLQLPTGASSPTLLAPSVYTVAANSFSLYLNGTIAKANVLTVSAALYVGFTFPTLPNGQVDPELDVVLTSAAITIGPSSNTGLTGTANGILIINSAGLAASFSVTVAASITGITLNSSVALALNTSGSDQSFYVPLLKDALGKKLAGTDATYTVPGSFFLNGVNQTKGSPYLGVTGNADIAVAKFDANGSFDFVVTPNLFRLDLNSLAFNVPGLSSFHLTAAGGIIISSAGLAGYVALSAGGSGIGGGSGSLFEVDGSFLFEINTTNASVDFNPSSGKVTIPAGRVEVDVAGDVKVGPAGSQFDVAASVAIIISGSGVSLSLYGGVNLGSLGSLMVGTKANPSTLTIDATGLKGNLSLTGSLSPVAGTTFNVTSTLVFDTSQSIYKLDASGDLLIGGGAFDLNGNFHFLVNPGGFTLSGDFHVSVFGVSLAQGDFYASIYKDTNGSSQFALYAGLNVGGGVTLPGTNFGFTLYVSPSLFINTGSTPQSYKTYTMAAQTAQFRIDNANIQAFGFAASGSLVATISNGGFDFQIPMSNPISLSFLGLGGMQVYGDFNSNGTFSITGQIGFDAWVGPIELYGGIGVTIANTGFAAWFYGGANLDCGIFGVVNLASIGASITLMTDHVEMAAHVKVLGIGFDFDYNLGGYTPPAHSPGLAFYNTPTAAGAGGTPTLSAQAYDPNNNAVAGSSLVWQISGPTDSRTGQPYSATGTGTSYVPTLYAPGTYNVSLFESDSYGYRQLKTSTITVSDVAPTVGDTGVGGSYTAVGGAAINPVTGRSTATPIIFYPAVSATNTDFVTYAWTLTKNGQPFSGSSHILNANTANPTIYPDVPATTGNALPDLYTATLTVSDPWGGSTHSSSSFTVFNPNYIVVNSTLDDWKVGDPRPSDHVTLREVWELLVQQGKTSGTPSTIHLAPSLAGQTILLGQYAPGVELAPGSNNTPAALATADVKIRVDGSDAPGITIAVDQSKIQARVFSIWTGARLELVDVNIANGISKTANNDGKGGAVFVDSGAQLISTNVAFLNNSAIADSGDYNGEGGAIFVNSGGSLSAYNTTFTGNLASSSTSTQYFGLGNGGAIYSAGGTVGLVSCTIAGNTARATGGSSYRGGGGVYLAGGSGTEFHNSIIGGNTGENDLQNDVNVSFYGSTSNLVSSLSYGLAQSIPTIVAAANLGLLAQRDGIWTYSLLPTSRALNAGDTVEAQGAGLATDARGADRFARNASGAITAIDIGAFQHQASYVVTSTNSAGAGSIQEAITADDDGVPITFAPVLSGIAVAATSTDATTKLTTTIYNNGPILVTRNVAIVGPGADKLTISGGNLTRLLQVASGVTATISGLAFVNGLGANRGGAIYVNPGANLTVTNSVFRSNSALADTVHYSLNSDGGAIFVDNNASLTIVGDTFTGNLAQGATTSNASNAGYTGTGGAIYVSGGSTLTGNDDTFSGNKAVGGSNLYAKSAFPAYGGAIHSSGTVSLTNVTMAFNTVANGSGTPYPTTGTGGADVWVDGGTSFRLVNSIAANPTGGTDITNYGTFTGSNNLVMSSSYLPASVVASTADPLLRPLGNFGGTTPTLALKSGSPAVGAALVSALPSTDQRGFARSNPAVGDLGAFQLRSFVVTNTNDSGAGSLRQAILDDIDLAPITFSPSVFNSARTITLASPLSLPTDTSIVGPKSSILTINGAGKSRIFNVGSTAQLTISGLTLTGGYANLGGAVYNAGTLTLDNDDFVSNAAVGTADAAGLGAGGAVYNATGGTLTITNSTFDRNSATGASYATTGVIGTARGGAICGGTVASSSGVLTLTLVDDTFSGNTATGGNGLAGSYWGAPGYGGAVNTFGPTTIVNSTFAGNAVVNGTPSLGYSDGLDVVVESTGSLTLYNSILASTAGGLYDLINSGEKVSGAGNLALKGRGNLASGMIVSSASPNLGSLAVNGSGTPTFALLANSPALGAGVVGVAPKADQRGLARVVGGAVDIGAYQTQVIPVTPSVGGPYITHQGGGITLDASGTVNLSGSTLTYNWSFYDSTGKYITGTYAGTTASFSESVSFLAVGSYTVTVQVNDGLGGNHLVSASTSLTILPALTPTALVLPSSSVATPFDTADLTFTYPINTAATLAGPALTISVNGGSKIYSLPVTYTLVAGTASTYRITGLAALMAKYGEGSYTLNVDALYHFSDAYGYATGGISASWIYDATPPTSKMTALPTTESSPSFVVSATGTDPVPQPGVTVSGVASYDLYVATDGGALAYWSTVPASSPSATFAGSPGHSYGFQSFARDAAGNVEAKASAIEAGTYVANVTAPTTQVTYVDPSRQAVTISVAGQANNGNVLDHIDVYVSVDGGVAKPIGKVGSTSGSISYEAIADGTVHLYTFSSIGVDKAGNTEPTPTLPGALTSVSASFAAPTTNASP